MQVRDERSGGWMPLRGGTLELHRDLAVTAHSARIFLQRGERVHRLDEFEPFCQLQVRFSETPWTVRPGRFELIPDGEQNEEVVAMLAPVQLASLAMPVLASRDDGGPSSVTTMLYFRLSSPAQPDVRGLACGGARDDPGRVEAPTLPQIADALGAYATLTPR